MRRFSLRCLFGYHLPQKVGHRWQNTYQCKRCLCALRIVSGRMKRIKV